MIDIPPHTETPMHYTDSIDYLTVSFGTLELLLTDGKKYEIGQGDIVIQLANVHQWNNVSDSWARELLIPLEVHLSPFSVLFHLHSFP